MIRNLRDTTQKNAEQDWLKTNLAKFSRMLQGQRDLTNVGRMVLSELCPVVMAQLAEFYVLDGGEDPPRLTLLAGYGSEGQKSLGKHIGLGERLVGQCALEKRVVLLNNVPPDYVRISSGLGDAAPRSVLVLPLIFEGQVKGVLELASLEGFNPTHQSFLEQLSESISIVLNTIEANMRTEDLLKQSQSLAQQLQARQQELQNTNEELQEKARLLAHQNQEVERKNQEVEQARQALEEKAKQLALTSKYKSEFLANMSHELRTPLNSLLILSDQLSKNPEGNLTTRQTEFAKTIHSSGNDLLMLINDILDLAKIESGTVIVDPSEVRLDSLRGYVERTFRPVAETKALEFEIHFHPQLPQSMFTDSKRLQQIIKNLLSNAFKFTHQGRVTLSIEPVTAGWDPANEDLSRNADVLSFVVSDTGIGIAADKQQIIFEAFQQADAGTNRKYGGTGLGLAISRELSRLLGGEIRLASNPGRGSSFVLYLPTSYTPPRARKPAATETTTAAPAPTTVLEARPVPAVPVVPPKQSSGNEAVTATLDVEHDNRLVSTILNELGDDRDNIRAGDRVLLIVENDISFARFLLDTVRENGFKGIATSLGATALALTREYQPSAISLDIYLPDIAGWRVLERLKNDIATRHIPVCVISTDDAREQAFASGAIAFVPKPISSRDVLDNLLMQLGEYTQRSKKCVLVVEPEPELRSKIVKAVQDEDIEVVAVSDATEALKRLRTERLDSLIVNPLTTSLAEELVASGVPSDRTMGRLAIILYGQDHPVGEDHPAWRRLGQDCVVRRVYSPERLLDMTTYFLHRPVTTLPEVKQELLRDLYQSDKVLSGKKVLIVDDDIRNIFALTTVLEEHDMNILSADNGHDAIKILKEHTDVDAVLMDIMMPVMDGLETMREIRKLPALRDLPLIAVTAKAMKGDREKCIEAGAWDYLAKPVNPEQMLTVLRAWLHR
jgi:signal transduction histidine kinase/DNA-binding response OmpR family regulator